MLLRRSHWLLVLNSLWIVVPSVAVPSVTLTQIAAPAFGIIISGASGRQFMLNTDDTITGSHANDYIGGANAGHFIIEDTSSPATMNISVTTLGTLGGLTVNEALCSYNGGIQQSCGGSGITVISSDTGTLRLGLEVTTSTAHRGGDAATAMLELTVAYL